MTQSNLSSVLRRVLFALIGGSLAIAAACGDESHADVGTVTLALVQVPMDVACISVTVTGNRTVTRLADVMPGQPSTLTFGGLPVGSDTFTGSAFSTSCASVTASSVPTWVGVPVTAVVTAMSSTPVTLVLQRNGRASVSIDFDDGTACGPMSCPTGCCSAGMCMPGNTTSGCGTGGGACQQCAPGQSCSGGTCTSTCDAASCPNGCCAGATCVVRTVSACAPGGAACAACDPAAADNCNPMGFCACGLNPSCPPGSTCSGGACVAAGCNPMSCPNGCCVGATCVARSVMACGPGGAACMACNPIVADNCSPSGSCACGSGPACANGQHCAAGACVCDATSCANGCCAGSTCLLGVTAMACGANGSACVSCVPPTSCTNQHCM